MNGPVKPVFSSLNESPHQSVQAGMLAGPKSKQGYTEWRSLTPGNIYLQVVTHFTHSSVVTERRKTKSDGIKVELTRIL